METRNCKFKFKCDKRWDDLLEVDEDSSFVRFCGTCSEEVFLVKTKEQLWKAMEANACVAMPLPIEGVEWSDDAKGDAVEPEPLMGEVVFDIESLGENEDEGDHGK